MTNKENVVASYMEEHNNKEILVWNFCLLNYDKLTKLFETELFYDKNWFEKLRWKAVNDLFNLITSNNGKFMRVDKSDCHK